MKRLALIAVAIAVMLLAAPSLYAQAGTFITANVPFDFFVGNDRMPAGEYRIAYYGNSDRLVIQNRTSGDVITILSYPEDRDVRGANPRLIFHSYYGKSFFLVRVAMPGSMIQELPQIHTERELSAKALPEEVTLVARVYR
ncbi:MAG: hypothetical protein ROO76_19740 [Terriglobia bacterium]|jgi:hypothetical protein|nr:hypothetical protein [Terriglobia bacterium]